MPFRSGSISYARFAVRGGPTAVTTELLEQLADNVLKPILMARGLQET